MYDKILNMMIDYCDRAADRKDMTRLNVAREIITNCHEIFKQSEKYCKRTPGADFTAEDIYEASILNSDLITVCEWEGAKWYELRYVTNSVVRRFDTIQEAIDFMVESTNSSCRYMAQETLAEIVDYMSGLFGHDAAVEMADHVKEKILAKPKMSYLMKCKEEETE